MKQLWELSQQDIEDMATADGYAAARLGMDLYPWQLNVLCSVSRRGSRVAVRTCNESGKTSTVVISLILWHMETQTNSLTVTTSGSYRQIKDQLYPHLQSWGGKLGAGWEFGDGWGKYHPTGARLVSFSTDNPGKAEGWHEPPDSTLLIIMDEAKTPPQEIYDAFERCHATYWVNLSSPGAPHGPFYDCFNKFSKRWKTFRVTAMDCPHLWDDPVKRAELDDQIKNLRTELVQSMIYGEFMPAGAGQLFDMACVAFAMTGDAPHVGSGQYRRAAYDNSAGGDEQVLAVCDGNRAWFEWTGFERDDHRQVEIVKHHLLRNGIRPCDCWSDDGGVGRLINDQFDRSYEDEPVDEEKSTVRRFDFSGEAHDKKLYRNARAEAYFKLADLIRLGRVILPDDEKLREELAFCRYDYDSTPLKLIEKSKLPRSPNRADALVMLFWEIDFDLLTAPPEDHSDRYSPTRQPRDRDECAAGPWDK